MRPSRCIGLLAPAYHYCLAREFIFRGIRFETEAPLAVRYREEVVDCAYRIDFLVEGRLLVELKSVERLSSLHKAQLLTYLRLSNRKLGLLVNFNSVTLKDGIVRVVNGL
ncbi:GxxExxY protein [Thioalkalivibrio denitrificans]|uniref:GxxExxY protein n=1 Tax=Thioalkalivibrio denitrificans TaxID=108003 RepID=UPI0026AA4FF8